MTEACKSYDELPAMLNAASLSRALGISRAGAYNLLNRRDFPTLRIGKRVLAPKEKVVEWINRNSQPDMDLC